MEIVCARCSATFAITPSHYNQRSAKSKTGLMFCSKACSNARVKSAVSVACRTCATEIVAIGGNRRKCDRCKSEYARQKAAEWYTANKTRANASSAAYARLHSEKTAATKRAWALRNIASERVRCNKKQRAWQKANPEKARAKKRKSYYRKTLPPDWVELGEILYQFNKHLQTTTQKDPQK